MHCGEIQIRSTITFSLFSFRFVSLYAFSIVILSWSKSRQKNEYSHYIVLSHIYTYMCICNVYLASRNLERWDSTRDLDDDDEDEL